MNLIVATGRGVVIAEREERGWGVTGRTLETQYVTSVIAREGVILAGSREGVWRSDDKGATWRAASDGLAISHVRWLAYHPQLSDYEYAGTEPAGIFYSLDGARTWLACAEVEAMREQYGWRLPYSPEAGCVRGFAFHGQRAYAAVEDGGVLLSNDVGQTWVLAQGSEGTILHHPPQGKVHSDVHSIAVHQAAAERVVAPTGGGLFASGDGGETWRNLYPCYCRAVWLDPQDVDHLVFGPADGVDRQGRIEESRDGGRTWHAISESLGAPWSGHMVERLSVHGDQLFAVLSNGDLLAATIDAWRWQRLLPEIGQIHGVAFMGDWG